MSRCTLSDGRGRRSRLVPRGAASVLAALLLAPLLTVVPAALANPDKPLVSITAVTTSPVAEGATVSFTVSVTPTQATNLNVDVSVDRAFTSATPNSRGTNGIRSVTVPADQSSATLRVATDNDNEDDPGRGVTAAIVARDRYRVSPTADSATALVTETDASLVSLSGEAFVTEGSDGTDSVTVSLGRELVAGEIIEVPLSFATTTGARIGGTTPDFTLTATGTGVMLTGAATAAPMVRFEGADAQRAELVFRATSNIDADSDAELVTISFANLSASSLNTNVQGGAAADATANSASLRILDNQGASGKIRTGAHNKATCDETVVVSEYDGSQESGPVSDCFLLALGEAPPVSAGQAPNDGVVIVASVSNDAARVPSSPRVHRGISKPTRWDRDLPFEVWAVHDGIDNPGGQRTATVTLTAKVSVPGTALADLEDVPGGVYAQLPQVEVQVLDVDPTTVTVGPADTPDALAKEGTSADTAKFKVSLGRALVTGESLAIPLSFEGGTAGTDFLVALDGSPTGVTYHSGTVTFTGPSSDAATFAVTAASDSDTISERVRVSVPAESTSNSTDMTATGLAGGAVGSGSALFVLVESSKGVLVDVGDSGVLEINEYIRRAGRNPFFWARNRHLRSATHPAANC